MGASLGDALGSGVGKPSRYVGFNVGDIVGTELGDAVGGGVASNIVAVYTPEDVAAESNVIFFPSTDVTSVLLGKLEDDTVSPTSIPVEDETKAAVESFVVLMVTTITLAGYVGLNDGSTVGALLGEADGIGVGKNFLYVGFRVGSTVGASVGAALGSGVGTMVK